jgi:glutamate dehydrogenase/leucine dehydrogenase
VTTVDAPVSHLRENPFEIAREQLRRVAKAFAIDPNLVNVLQDCKKAVSVSVPVAMDDGTTSRAARPRAASATTRTSRSTRSRRSRCG